MRGGREGGREGGGEGGMVWCGVMAAAALTIKDQKTIHLFLKTKRFCDATNRIQNIGLIIVAVSLLKSTNGTHITLDDHSAGKKRTTEVGDKNPKPETRNPKPHLETLHPGDMA